MDGVEPVFFHSETDGADIPSLSAITPVLLVPSTSHTLSHNPENLGVAELFA